MATITLNIYKKDNKEEVEKTYSTEGYDLMMGTVEDIIDVVDIEKMGNEKEVIKMVMSGFSKLKPFIKDIFPGITDDEIKCTKVKELIPMFAQVIAAVKESIETLNQGN